MYYGPSARLSLNGQLTLRMRKSGSTSGVLVTADGSRVAVVGEVDGRAMHLLFELGDGTHISGVSTSQHDAAECRGTAGGPLADPDRGDLGDWGFAWGS